MIQSWADVIVWQLTYWQLFLLVTGYFLILYFGLAPLFLRVCQYLQGRGMLRIIVDRAVPASQIRREQWHSLKSIVVFGLSALPVVYLIRNEMVVLLENTLLNVLVGVVLLTVWNEVHFFAVHRLMHLPFFMRRVHFVHHQSHVPTVYSVYSFHWLEAILLSTVPLTFIGWVPIAPLAIFLFPSVSVLLNYAGHCNYRFGSRAEDSWWLLGTRHNDHHARGRKNYGFALPWLDKLYAKFNRRP